MAENYANDSELLRLVVEEVDEARETLELVYQLQRALPLKSFAEVTDATNGEISFRGNAFDLSIFEGLIPELVFPIQDVEQLVQLAYQVVLAAPPSVTYDLEDPENAKREMQRSMMRRFFSDGGLTRARPGPGMSRVMTSMVDRPTTQPHGEET